MIEQIISKENLNLLRQYVDNSTNVVITCHVSPDGDAIGASLGLKHIMEAKGKKANVVTPDMMPNSLSFLPGASDVVSFSFQEVFAKRLISAADLIICVDFNSLSRIGKLAQIVESKTAVKVMIDHHLNPDAFCDLTISHSDMSSTCELLFRAIYHLNLMDAVSVDCASCIYTGMMTDTGNFTYNCKRSDLYLIIAELIKKGIDKESLYNLAMNTNSVDRLRLCGYAISEKLELYPESGGTLITLSQAELKRFNYQRGDTEALVNTPLTIPGYCWSVFMRQDADCVKVSARSRGDFAVNTICERYFNGGGHKNASGGEFYGTLEAAVAVYHEIIENLKNNKK